MTDNIIKKLIKSKSGLRIVTEKEEQRSPFIIQEPQWVPDKEATNCTNCSVKFGFTTRKVINKKKSIIAEGVAKFFATFVVRKKWNYQECVLWIQYLLFDGVEIIEPLDLNHILSLKVHCDKISGSNSILDLEFSQNGISKLVTLAAAIDGPEKKIGINWISAFQEAYNMLDKFSEDQPVM
uniref:Uncharacterized protein n=1 Tax=Rhodnius prolixus TaxID=13249 RepID=T1HI92_RHOPR